MMLNYIKEYGITDADYIYITHNLNRNIIETMILTEPNIRKVLAFYNSLGITKNIAKIIMARPDLIIIPKESLSNLLTRIDRDLLVTIIDNDLNDLILLGI